MTKVQAPTIAELFRQSGQYSGPGVCPHCGNVAMFQHHVQQGLNEARIRPHAASGATFAARVFSCLACRSIVFGLVESRGGFHTGHHLWPPDVWPDRSPPDVEPEIKQYYDEARVILTFSPAAAAALARRCLQHVVRKRLGIEKRKLFDEIEEACKREELSKPTRESLHHIREIGNWAAHADVNQAGILTDVTIDDAKYTLEALEMVFDDLYVATARAAKMQERVAARKGTANAVT